MSEYLEIPWQKLSEDAFEGMLQVAPNVNGPWENVDGSSPLIIQAGDMKGSEFFRSKE